MECTLNMSDQHNTSERASPFSERPEISNEHIRGIDSLGYLQQQRRYLDSIERTLQITGEDTLSAAHWYTLNTVQTLSIISPRDVALLLLLCLRHIDRIRASERTVGVSVAAQRG